MQKKNSIQKDLAVVHFGVILDQTVKHPITQEYHPHWGYNNEVVSYIYILVASFSYNRTGAMSLLFKHKHLFSKSVRFYSSKTLVQLEKAQVHRFGIKEPAFKNLSLTLKNDERLVIVGPVSAGKTTLAEVISLTTTSGTHF